MRRTLLQFVDGLMLRVYVYTRACIILNIFKLSSMETRWHTYVCVNEHTHYADVRVHVYVLFRER